MCVHIYTKRERQLADKKEEIFGNERARGRKKKNFQFSASKNAYNNFWCQLVSRSYIPHVSEIALHFRSKSSLFYYNCRITAVVVGANDLSL